MSSILFAKHVSFEHSVSSPRPVITSRREKNNNKAKVFQHPMNSQSASCSLISRHVLSARAVGARPRCSEFLSNRKYRSYTQTDDTHCWPWARGGGGGGRPRALPLDPLLAARPRGRAFDHENA